MKLQTNVKAGQASANVEVSVKSTTEVTVKASATSVAKMAV